MKTAFTATFKKVGDWYIGWVEELPGANTQGRTLEEARENLREAIELIIASNRELARAEMGEEGLTREKIVIDV